MMGWGPLAISGFFGIMVIKKEAFTKEGNDMSMDFSRRDFLKCAGGTVLALGTGSLLTGCGSSSSGYGTAGMGEELTFNGITVKVNKCSQKDVKAEVAGFEAQYKNYKFLYPEVTLTNTTGKPLYIDNNKNFTLKADGSAAAGWTTTAAETVIGSGKLLGGSTGAYVIQDGESATGVVAFAVKTGWQSAELCYTPDTNNPKGYFRFVFTSEQITAE